MDLKLTLPLVYDFDLSELENRFRQIGQPAYRAKQLWTGLYRHLWHTPEAFSNLPGDLRQVLAETYNFSGLLPAAEMKSSDAETQKILFELYDGNSIETVHMRYNERQSICVSSQAGCAMGCVFCATGQMGFRRHLSSGEIVEQVLYYARQLGKEGEVVTNVVVMGMGEPFHNYDATLEAVDRLNHPQGLNLGARRFTISTVGLIPGIKRFTAEDRQVNLAVSLHAADDDLRNSLIPTNRKYNLDMLFEACEEYVNKTNRRLSFEWALIRGVNDGEDQARKLAKRLQVFRRGGSALCHVNIILLNPTRRYEGQATTRQQAQIFQEVLAQAGIPCTIRLRRGIDIQAGCGQLAIEKKTQA